MSEYIKSVPKSIDELTQIEKSYIVMNDVISKMPVEKIMLENLYFYNHQINKIQFLMRIARKSFNFLSIIFFLSLQEK